MSTKDAFKRMATDLAAALGSHFAATAETDAHRQLLGAERIEGKLLDRVAAATMSAVVDPTLRDRNTPTRSVPVVQSGVDADSPKPTASVLPEPEPRGRRMKPASASVSDS